MRIVTKFGKLRDPYWMADEAAQGARFAHNFCQNNWRSIFTVQKCFNKLVSNIVHDG